MPFTLAHPAAVLPLGRWRLVSSALVAGAMAPDVVFYLPGWAQGLLPGTPVTHSARGLVGIDLLLGLVLVLLWRVLLRRPWLSLLPRPWRAAALGQTDPPVLDRSSGARLAGSAAMVVLSVLLGTVTHLLLDLLTHDPGVVRGPAPAWLEVPVGGIPLYDALQWLLSAVGLALLAWWAWGWARRHGGVGVATRADRRAVAVLAVTGVAAIVGGTVALLASDAAGSPAGAVTAILVGSVGWAALALGAYAVAWWAVRLTRPRRRAAPATSPAGRRPSRTAG